jgi:capsid protein
VNGQIRMGDAKPYEPNQLCYIVKLERPSCIRGVPLLQSAFAQIYRLAAICDAETLARQVQSRFAIASSRLGGPGLGWTESKRDPAIASNAQEGKITTRVTEIPEAIIFHGEQGDEIKGIERTAPGAGFEETMSAFLRIYGQTIGLPLELITLNWTKSNYSQSRAVLEQAFVRFLGHQALLRRNLHEPVYRWVIGRAIAGGKLAPRPDWQKHDWIPPSFPWIDALLEAQAWGAKLDRSFATQAQVLKSLNLDPDAVLAQRVREIKRAIEEAKRIKAETGVDVDWHVLAGLAASVNPPGTPAKDGESQPPKEKAA